MTIVDNQMVWRQFSAALDSLGDALRACPEALWERSLWEDEPEQWVASGFASFWYLGYHALFWVDLYLTGAEEGFAPPAPFALVEMEAGEVLPPVYTRDQLLGYLEHCRQRCQETLAALSAEEAQRLCRFPWGEIAFGELMLYTMRHVQEHAGQLHMFLGQQARKGGG